MRTTVYISSELEKAIREYNEKNPSAPINLSKIAQAGLKEFLEKKKNKGG